jgi:hypothetical protein
MGGTPLVGQEDVATVWGGVPDDSSSTMSFLVQGKGNEEDCVK